MIRSVLLIAFLVCSLSLLCHASDPEMKATQPVKETKRGDMLKTMEWIPGSDDVSMEDFNRPNVFTPEEKDFRPPGRVFGLSSAAAGEMSDKDGLMGHYKSHENLEAAQLGAKLVDAYSDTHNPSRQGSSAFLKEYLG